MKYMMLIASAETAWDGLSEDERRATYQRIESWWNDNATAGRIVGGHELHPSATATTVRRGADGAVSVTDGPFMEGKEMVGGYAVLEAPDLDAAIRLASGWPSSATLELRPIVEER